MSMIPASFARPVCRAVFAVFPPPSLVYTADKWKWIALFAGSAYGAFRGKGSLEFLREIPETIVQMGLHQSVSWSTIFQHNCFLVEILFR